MSETHKNSAPMTFPELLAYLTNRDRYKAALEEIRDHATDDNCDGECALAFVDIASRALEDDE